MNWLSYFLWKAGKVCSKRLNFLKAINFGTISEDKALTTDLMLDK